MQTVRYEGQDYHIEVRAHQKAEVAEAMVEKREDKLKKEQARFLESRRRRQAEMTDSWRISDTRFAVWIKMVEDQREENHVNTVALKDSFLRHLDHFTVTKAVKLMEVMYPRYAEVFILAYPLDDEVIGLRDPKDSTDAKCLTQEDIALRLHLSQPTVSRTLDKARFFFKALYLGVISHPFIEEGEREE